MRVPLAITFRHMETSPAAEKVIRERARKLEKFCDDISRCDVVLEAPHQHHHQGNLYSVRIHVTVPGDELTVHRTPDAHQAYEDPYVAIGDAFDQMRRQLGDYMRKRRGDVKAHATRA